MMIEKLPFGRTGHLSSRLLFGAAALGGVTQEEADRTMETLLQYGINHLDTAASYGEAELRLGPWVKRMRGVFFLATKTGERTYQEARKEIQRSLERLQTDHVDLIQLHNLIEPAEWEMALGPGGALEAAIEARQQKMVRYIGVTGHTLSAPLMHKRSLERFDFDSVLLPYNFMLMQNAQYAEDFKVLLEMCKERGVAVQLIKTLQRRPYGERERSHATWYEPFVDQKAVDLATHYALGLPGVFINTAGDITVLPKILEAAQRYSSKPADEAMRVMLAEQQAEPLWA